MTDTSLLTGHTYAAVRSSHLVSPSGLGGSKLNGPSVEQGYDTSIPEGWE